MHNFVFMDSTNADLFWHIVRSTSRSFLYPYEMLAAVAFPYRESAEKHTLLLHQSSLPD